MGAEKRKRVLQVKTAGAIHRRRLSWQNKKFASLRWSFNVGGSLSVSDAKQALGAVHMSLALVARLTALI